MEEECKHRVPPRRRRRARHWWRTQLQTRASTDAYTVNRPAMNMKWANLNSLLFTFLILIAGKIRLFWSNYSRHLRLIKKRGKKIPWFLHLVNATTIFQKMGNISCAIMKNKLNIFRHINVFENTIWNERQTGVWGIPCSRLSQTT